MGLPINSDPPVSTPSTTTLTLPVYKLSNTKVVLLPGILYRLNLSERDALNLLSFYKNNSKINNLLISNVKIPKRKSVNDEEQEHKGETTPHIISDASISGSRSLRRFINSSKGDEKAYDWLIIGVLPTDGDKILTVSRIVGISNDGKNNVIFTFQALTRAEIISNQGQNIKFKKNIMELPLRVYSNAVELSGSYLKSEIGEFNALSSGLFSKIDGFLHDFLIVGSTDKSNIDKSSTKKYGLTLSPLANALNVQFSNDYKNSAIKLKRLIEKFNSTFDQFTNKRNSEQFLKIVDLVVAILPGEKYEFLSKLVVEERLEYFKQLIKEFDNIFKSLYDSIDYVDRFYSQASDSEKSRIISNQLKSIRFSLDALKSGKPSQNGSNGGPSSQSDDQNDELQLVHKFMSNLPLDVDADGVKLLTKDYNRLKKMPQQHSEYQVLRTYFDIILDIPFGQYISFNQIDINKVSQHLDDDHYGLHHVKKRLLQYLSVLKLHEINELNKLSNGQSSNNTSNDHTNTDEFIIGNYQEDLVDSRLSKTEDKNKVSKPLKSSIKSPILLFVGPPGVGKTSLAKSIANSLGRKFQRVSLGGIRDESEIRGHRRTYVGSLPGVIINALRKAGSMNPLILLDEIDKVCGGANSAGRVNGDPEAALLEVLDPEQNWSFTDHYIGFPVDLSNVLFLCTANELGSISAPLRDRMEVIEISGYTFEEKLQIGSRFLLPKQIKQNGLPSGSVIIHNNIWEKLIQEYIREAGVRNLERKVAAICRGKAVEYVKSNNDGSILEFVKEVEPNKLVKYLGLPNHPITKDILSYPKYSKAQGVVNGLAYNSDGSGSVLVFEVISIPSLSSKAESTSPRLIMTGRLGETLTESIKIGLTFIKSIISRDLITNIDSRQVLKQFNNSELHLHVPMGSIPKDGPSAGITITLALLSIALNRPVPADIAMTGEITLRGKVLPIGGIGEKLLGASQNGIKKVLLPKLNRKDIIETFFGDDEDKLIGFLKDGVVVEGYGEPEKKVRHKLGLDIVYVDSFFDVIKAVWGDQVTVVGEDQLEHHL